MHFDTDRVPSPMQPANWPVAGSLQDRSAQTQTGKPELWVEHPHKLCIENIGNFNHSTHDSLPFGFF